MMKSERPRDTEHSNHIKNKGRGQNALRLYLNTSRIV